MYNGVWYVLEYVWIREEEGEEDCAYRFHPIRSCRPGNGNMENGNEVICLRPCSGGKTAGI